MTGGQPIKGCSPKMVYIALIKKKNNLFKKRRIGQNDL